MITAKEAREIVESIDKSQKYLTTLNTNIKLAANNGRNSTTLLWDERINNEIFIKVEQTLVDNGYTVKSIPASYYYEYGAIKVEW